MSHLELNPNASHGLSNLPEYQIWFAIIQRCTNKKNKAFRNYGGRGIKIAPEWTGPEGFKSFLAHVGLRPSRDLSLDRIDVNGNYEPGNMRWATAVIQGRNKRKAGSLTIFSDAELADELVRRGYVRPHKELETTS